MTPFLPIPLQLYPWTLTLFLEAQSFFSLSPRHPWGQGVEEKRCELRNSDTNSQLTDFTLNTHRHSCIQSPFSELPLLFFLQPICFEQLSFQFLSWLCCSKVETMNSGTCCGTLILELPLPAYSTYSSPADSPAKFMGQSLPYSVPWEDEEVKQYLVKYGLLRLRWLGLFTFFPVQHLRAWFE